MTVSRRLPLLALLLLVVVAGFAPTTFAADPPDAGSSETPVVFGEWVTPTRFDGDLRDLPEANLWRPGDPVKEVPRRFYPGRVQKDAATPSWMESAPDPLVARQAGATANPELTDFGTPILNFAGLGYTGVNPPDVAGDVGPNHFIQSINGGGGAVFRVFNKDGTPATGILDMTSLGGSGACTSTLGDPIVLYDRPADRWFLLEFSSQSGNSLCIHVSQTADPVAGGWYNYTFVQADFPDYPHCGVWPDTYYCTANENTGGIPVYAFDRANILAGLAARPQQTFRTTALSGYGFQALTPVTFTGSALPPGGTPFVVARQNDDEAHAGGGADLTKDFIDLYAVQTNWTTPASSSFTALPRVNVAEFNSWFLNYSTFATVPQPGSSSRLDPIREVILNRMNYRNFGTHETIVGTWATNLFPERTGSNVHSGVRWFELRRTPAGSGSWSLQQEGTFASPTSTSHRLLGSAIQDGSGNIALGYNTTETAPGSIYPSIWYTGRLSSDPPGTMTAPEVSLAPGAAANTSGRWGDYATMGLDPVDDCTFWFTSQMQPSSSWATQISTFKFQQCGCLTVPAAPTGLGASASAPNEITVSWSDAAASSITRYFVFRSTASGGPFTQIATVTDTSPGAGGSGTYAYVDTGRSGGTTYYYVVRADDGVSCTSADSAEASALATGPCLLSPAFAGLATATSPGASTCTITLSWATGASSCGNGVTYDVFRSTTAGFVPGPANRIATGLATTGHTDLDMLVSGTRYYYVVRAVDSGTGAVDPNTVERSAVAWGPATIGTWTAGGEAADPTMTLGTPWNLTSTYARTGAAAYHSGYLSSSCASLTTPPLILGTGSVLSWHALWSTESGYDGGRVEISSDGGTNWAVLTPAPAYPGTITSSGNSCSWSTTTPVYIGNSTSYPTAWQAASANLSPTYDGKTVLVRWRFATDGSVAGNQPNPGWYVDDISITQVAVPGPCATGSACPANPTSVDVTPNGPVTRCTGTGQALTASITGGTTPFSYQWTRDGIDIGGANGPTFTPNETGTHDYNVKVFGSGCATPLQDAAPTQVGWRSVPTFAGVTSVTNPSQATCRLDLAWSAASTPCSGPVTYKVYRSTTTPVAAIPANLVATGVAGTTYSDTAGLASGATYHYLVRAVDSSTGGEETNVVERSGSPTGPSSLQTLTDTFEGSASGGGFDLAGWTHSALSGTVDWAWSTAQSNTPTHSWFSDSQTSVSARALVSPPFEANASTTLSFFHTYDFEGTTTCYDAGTLEVTTNGGATWTVVPDAAFVAGGFTGTVSGSYSNPLAGKRAWCFGTIGTMTQVQVNLASYAGSTIRVRWHEGDDSSSKAVGWYVDSVVIANAGSSSSCTTAAAGPRPVPDGAFVAGTPMRATPSGKTGIVATWDVTTCPASNYNLYSGALGSWGAFTGGACALGTTGSSGTVAMPPDSWWIVAGTSGSEVSSFWKDSSGAEPTVSGWGAGGVCPTQTAKNISGSCP